MPLLEKQLFVRYSTIPGAGKGLFTKKMILKGTRIIEYKGKISTWKNADHKEGLNAYIYYVNRNHVIDASSRKDVLARYVNDAKGQRKIQTVKNNCKYVQEDLRVFVQAIKDIPANSEILVNYGKKYWDIILENRKQAEIENKKLRKKKLVKPMTQ